MTQTSKFGLGRVENIVGKRENANASDLHFLLFPQCFQRTCQGGLKLGLFGEGLRVKCDPCTVKQGFDPLPHKDAS